LGGSPPFCWFRRIGTFNDGALDGFWMGDTELPFCSIILLFLHLRRGHLIPPVASPPLCSSQRAFSGGGGLLPFSRFFIIQEVYLALVPLDRASWKTATGIFVPALLPPIWSNFGPFLRSAKTRRLLFLAVSICVDERYIQVKSSPGFSVSRMRPKIPFPQRRACRA